MRIKGILLVTERVSKKTIRVLQLEKKTTFRMKVTMRTRWTGPLKKQFNRFRTGTYENVEVGDSLQLVDQR